MKKIKILHILRSKPDEMVKQLIAGVSSVEESIEIPIYHGEVDYDLLVEQIFGSDQIISWW